MERIRFLLVFNILCCTVSDIARCWPKIANLNLPHHCLEPVGATPLEFRRDICHQKTRVPELSYGVVFVILSLAVGTVQCRL